MKLCVVIVLLMLAMPFNGGEASRFFNQHARSQRSGMKTRGIWCDPPCPKGETCRGGECSDEFNSDVGR
uniref:Conotoxin Cal14.13a n=1 Tax=Californiconus californicus TaxID=1736779 RepID=CUEDA_CONCL|nr:RecName: Full=Conotoxin Cal14.13a; AltName: Full=Conotoxin Cal14.1a; Flags: Precursor [Californiconus californicus]ADB28952.1 conotoxin Cal 14.1a precursor [Californiconus californicus]